LKNFDVNLLTERKAKHYYKELFKNLNSKDES